MNIGIYQAFDGTHIDLSKIVDIGPVYASDNDGWQVTAGFDVRFQLRDTPATYHWRGDVKENAAVKGSNVTWDDMPYTGSGENSFDKWSPILIERVTIEHRKMVDAWKDYRAWVTRNSIMRPE